MVEKRKAVKRHQCLLLYTKKDPVTGTFLVASESVAADPVTLPTMDSCHPDLNEIDVGNSKRPPEVGDWLERILFCWKRINLIIAILQKSMLARAIDRELFLGPERCFPKPLLSRSGGSSSQSLRSRKDDKKSCYVDIEDIALHYPLPGDWVKFSKVFRWLEAFRHSISIRTREVSNFTLKAL